MFLRPGLGEGERGREILQALVSSEFTSGNVECLFSLI